MPPVVVPSTVRVVTYWTFNLADWALNVTHWINLAAVAVTAGTADMFDDGYKSSFALENLDAELNSGVRVDRHSVRDLDTPNQPEFFSTDPAVAGTSLPELLPQSTALVATFRTPFAGRAFRGRWYQWGFSETANVAGGTASAAAQTALQNTLRTWNLTMQSVGFTLGVASTRSHDAMGAPNPPFITPVTSIEVRDGTWDTQRRRAEPGI